MEDELQQRAADYLSSVLGFNDERVDPVLGAYHLGNGYSPYSPLLRRFTSPDSIVDSRPLYFIQTKTHLHTHRSSSETFGLKI